MRCKSLYSATILFLFLLSGVFFGFGYVFAQETVDFTHSSTGDLKFSIDSAGFPQEPGKALLEIYFKVPYDQLVFKEVKGQDGIYEAGFNAAVRLKNMKGETVLSTKYDFPFRMKGKGEGESGYDLFRCSVPPGKYRCEVDLSDMNGKNKGSVEFFTNIRKWPEGDQIWGPGDIQLAWDVTPGKPESDFMKRLTKYGVTIIPNAGRTYSFSNPFLSFYYEVVLNSDVSKDVLVNYEICDRYGKLYKSYPSSGFKWKPGVNAEWGKLPIVTLPSDFYFFRIRVFNKVGEQVAGMRKLFLFRKNDEKINPLDLHTVLLEKEDLDVYSDKFIKYIGSPEDVTNYERLNTDYSRRMFIEDWWKKVAATKKVPATEYQQTILVRANIATTRYKDAYQEGWRSDRGRIYIKYGEPVDIERNPYDLDSEATEIWTYIIGGKERYFKFEDKTGNGDYRLMESNLEGEFYKDN